MNNPSHPDGGQTELDGLIELLGKESGKCISCGFCDSVCPTYEASGYDPAITARGRAQLGKRLFGELKDSGTSALKVSDTFYSCLDCHACVQICPTGVDAGRVSDIGRKIISMKGVTPGSREKPEAKMIVSATMKYSNPLGVREECALWAEGLEFSGDSETLLFTGNMYQLMAFSEGMKGKREKLGNTISGAASRLSSHFPSLVRAGSRSFDRNIMETMGRNLRNIVALLQGSGVSFGYLGQDEPYSGTFLNDLGYMREFREYAERVTEIFRKHGYRRIITVDPHTFELLRDVYPQYVEGFDFEVVFYMDLLDTSLLRDTGKDVVFHEPCHFALSRNEYNAPLRILSGIANTKLPERSGKRTYCCGGPAELLFGNLSEKISNNRFRQLKETGGESIITSCPICLVNLSKDESVLDISEILVESMSAGKN